jgi:hypothetical protein
LRRPRDESGEISQDEFEKARRILQGWLPTDELITVFVHLDRPL